MRQVQRRRYWDAKKEYDDRSSSLFATSLVGLLSGYVQYLHFSCILARYGLIRLNFLISHNGQLPLLVQISHIISAPHAEQLKLHVPQSDNLSVPRPKAQNMLDGPRIDESADSGVCSKMPGKRPPQAQTNWGLFLVLEETCKQ